MEWRTGPPPTESEPILVQVEVMAPGDEYIKGEPVGDEHIKGGTETHLCRVDDYGDLVDLQQGEDLGWDSTCVERWVPLSDIIAMLEGSA